MSRRPSLRGASAVQPRPSAADRPHRAQGGAAGSLAAWYGENGRHQLPWRQTRDPWAVLVSEVMLQQTPVPRVLPRWSRFLGRWPTPAACAASPLEEVLRDWDGLGYPRRAAALWHCARLVASRPSAPGAGWPRDEAGLRALPGIGPYTARALLVLALGEPSPTPHDVNIARVAARCFLGAESAPARSLDAALAAGRPAGMAPREYTLALLDVGALLCRRRSVACDRCPLGAGCRSRDRLAASGIPAAPRRQPPYAGSMRELRGAVLRAILARPGLGSAELETAVASLPQARRPGAVAEALHGLTRDGLLPG